MSSLFIFLLLTFSSNLMLLEVKEVFIISNFYKNGQLPITMNLIPLFFSLFPSKRRNLNAIILHSNIIRAPSQEIWQRGNSRVTKNRQEASRTILTI